MKDCEDKRCTWILEKGIVIVRKKLSFRNLLLILGTFFNPFGYDVVFWKVNDWVKSYWRTTAVFYCLAALCFLSYFLLNRRDKPM